MIFLLLKFQISPQPVRFIGKHIQSDRGITIRDGSGHILELIPHDRPVQISGQQFIVNNQSFRIIFFRPFIISHISLCYGPIGIHVCISWIYRNSRIVILQSLLVSSQVMPGYTSVHKSMKIIRIQVYRLRVILNGPFVIFQV